MKQFIVLLAVIPIMILFLMQFSLEERNAARIDMITDIVYAAKEDAKQQGGFDREKLRSELASKLDTDPSQIIIEAPGIHEVKRIQADGSRGIIRYKIIVPVESVLAGKKYLGIWDDVRYGYKIESSSPSEYTGE